MFSKAAVRASKAAVRASKAAVRASKAAVVDELKPISDPYAGRSSALALLVQKYKY